MVVALYFGKSTYKRVTYGRFLLEQSIGRCLEKEEKVYYKDGDRENVSLGNIGIKKVPQFEDTLYGKAKVYGPWRENGSGRLKMQLTFKDGSRRNIQYSKFIMEKHLNRLLSSTEIVHHLDHNVENNDLSNLVVMTRSDHQKGHHTVQKPAILICQYCKKPFLCDAAKLRNHRYARKKGHKGPFCSCACVGHAAHNIEKYERVSVVIEEDVPTL